jgi:hypothetical protein
VQSLHVGIEVPESEISSVFAGLVNSRADSRTENAGFSSAALSTNVLPGLYFHEILFFVF